MTINGIDIEVERKNIKHLHIAVYPPDGRVHISAPLTYSEEQITLYTLKKWVWIEQKIEEATSYQVQSERQYVSGEAHYFKGNLYRLKVERDNSVNHYVEIQGDYIIAHVHEKTTAENIASLIGSWYKDQLTPLLANLIERWEKILNVQVQEWTVMQMPSSWGKCHKATGKIMFNLQLAKKPVGCIEYVVAHELTHLIEQNHTDRFTHILQMNMPDWQELKKQLNEFPL